MLNGDIAQFKLNARTATHYNTGAFNITEELPTIFNFQFSIPNSAISTNRLTSSRARFHPHQHASLHA